MSYNLKQFYQALNGESSFNSNQWYISQDKRHSFKIYSDYDCIDGSENKINVPYKNPETLLNKVFSNTLGQKFVNTKIVDNGDGTESVKLELDDRVITLIIDNSGSTTWNDKNNYRYSVGRSLIQQIENNYPGNIFYNLVVYGSLYVDILLFAVKESEIESYNFNTVAQLSIANNDANFSGVVVKRREGAYPSDFGGLESDEVSDGFISRIFDDGLTEGQCYYYKVYTYDSNFKYSKGVPIKVTPRERVIPRGLSTFKTFVASGEMGKGRPLIGYGAIRDEYAIGLWHMDEGDGQYIYDFSDNSNMLTISDEFPAWLRETETAAGKSGLIFNGQSTSASITDSNDSLYANFSNGDDISIAAWIYPYSVNGYNTVVSRKLLSGGINYWFYHYNGRMYFRTGNTSVDSGLDVEPNKWQYVVVTHDTSANQTTFYLNNISSGAVSYTASISSYSGDFSFMIGNMIDTSYCFNGKITEVSVHNTLRDLEWVESQLVEMEVKDENGIVYDTYYVGRKLDNGDRLVVLSYEIPQDCNFSGGSVRIVKNDKKVPTWEEDGDIVYESSVVDPGIYYVQDSDDFSLGENYYYKIFTKNATGNYCFKDDAYALTVEIEKSNVNYYFSPLDVKIYSPAIYNGLVIQGGNKKNYLRWKNNYPDDERIKRVKIYCNKSSLPPTVYGDGSSVGTLVYTGSLSGNETSVMRDNDGSILYYYFVHRTDLYSINSPLENGQTYSYTIVFTDKYGRVSNFIVNENGDYEQVGDHLTAITSPHSDADETIFPLEEVNDIHYEIINNESVVVRWNKPPKEPEVVNAYFGESVIVYCSLIDQYGEPIPEDTPLKMLITPELSRVSQAYDVFNDTPLIEFDDKDAFEFNVDRTSEGILKATLRMTSNSSIMAQINSASFTVQLKAYLNQNSYEVGATGQESYSGNSLKKYYEILNQEIGDEGNADSDSGEVFSFVSKSIQINFTNPWEVEIENKNNLYVSERCYVEKTNALSGEPYLLEKGMSFNGVYMKASNPFIARAKLKYKGAPVESGSVQISVWEATMDGLCTCADADPKSNCVWEGEKIRVSDVVTAPSSTMAISQGYENGYDWEGPSQIPISYVDIPLYAPSHPYAVQLYVKGSQSGYSSVKNMYILFQNILKIDLTAAAPSIDGKSIAEQKASVFIINPDYPNYQTDPKAAALVTYPSNNTIVEWKIITKQGQDRSLYSTDNVSLTNGVYSYTRNGTARSVFLGPIERGEEEIDDIHEINASVTYQGLSDTARKFVSMKYQPSEDPVINARFLMELDGVHWMDTDGHKVWADGKDYQKIKIHRNPRDSEFLSTSAFLSCMSSSGNEIIELSSNQIIKVSVGGSVEILHGDITEAIDEYTGEKYLIVGEEGMVDTGSANIELEDANDSDITYFYIRTNEFVPDAQMANQDQCKETVINSCLALRPPNGITDCNVPAWTEKRCVSGTTTVFVNGNPLVLYGGGDYYNGIPPVCMSVMEPLHSYTLWRKIINTIEGEEHETIISSDDFVDPDGDTYITNGSEIRIRVVFQWRGRSVPDGTSAYVSIGENNSSNYFIADRSIYYTQTDEEGNSYIDVRIFPRKTPNNSKITEQARVYCTYDERGTVGRSVGTSYNLTLDSRISLPTCDDCGTDPGEPNVPKPSVSPHVKSAYRYSINDNSWDLVSSMSEGKGDAFTASSNGKIYVMGGVKNNKLDISAKTEIYDPLNDSWSLGANMPTPRFAGMTAVVGNDIYLIGGIGKDSQDNELKILRTVSVYHTATGEWDNSLQSMPNAGDSFEDLLGVAYGSACVAEVEVGSELRTYIYIVGGMKRIAFTKSKDDVFIYEYNERILRYWVEGDQWEYSVKLRSDELGTYERISPCSLLYDDKIIVFNGVLENNQEFSYPKENFYITVEESLDKLYGESYLTIGTSYIPSNVIPKFETSIVKYQPNMSDSVVYYLMGGWSRYSSSMNLVEKMEEGNYFTYHNSNENGSDALVPIPKSLHGMGAVWALGTDYIYSSDPSVENPSTDEYEIKPFIYVIGGFTTEYNDTEIDINFEL